ncbi:MAG: ABC transporter ATP-binding protein [Candidatus Aminicenantes bacterium]|jgi:ABC-2 type transport system ATP-binding protein|nr:ABC transporter ATP-binding protein [Candidatus Aminicenantes bacterium]
MFEPVVEVNGLTKVFKSFKAVDNVSFDIYPGEILGLLGPNGAGKTTIIHMLLGLTTPASGDINVFGFDLKKNREKIIQDVNFSSSHVSMPNSLTVKENLKVFARLYKVKKKEKRISELLKIFEIEAIEDKLVRHISSGHQTRLNLAKALINNPKILFLDEPTASLDPDIADKTRSLLKSIKKNRNLSILYTSHNMKEMEEMSDRIIFLHKGRIIAEGRPEEIIRDFRRKNLEEVFLKVAREEKI